jgi:excinuclease ABC subunit C
LIDGGLGQLHAAAEALEALGIVDQPLASIAKREELIYVYGQEDEPIALDRFSPILHLIQSIRDEAHRFAVTFHRTRRNAQRLTSELEQIEGVGEITVRKLLKRFGSSELVSQAKEEDLAAVVGKAAARKVKAFYASPPDRNRHPALRVIASGPEHDRGVSVRNVHGETSVELIEPGSAAGEPRE